MFYMGEHGGKPLLRQEFQAWDYGPVLPSVYHHLKVFGDDPIGNVFHRVPDVDDPEVVAHLRSAAEELGEMRPGDLVAITHWEKGAWARHYEPGERGIIIPNEDILDEYRARFDD